MLALQPTDEQLLREFAASGAHDAFEDLYRRLYGKLFHLILRKVRNVDNASEIVQTAFLKLFCRAAQYRGDRGSVYTYLSTIALNISRDRGRKIRLDLNNQPFDSPIFLSAIDHSDGPEQQSADREEHDNLIAAVGQMGPRYRRLLQITVIDGRMGEEAAAELGIPHGTVRSRRHRALAILRRLMAACLLMLCGIASASDPTAPTIAIRCMVERIHDADTVFGTLHLWPGIAFTPLSGIRAAGFDAWEVSYNRRSKATKDQPITAAEIAKGHKATEDLKELLATHDLFCEPTGEQSVYGRAEAIWWAKSKDGNGKWIFVGRWMEQRGHLRVPRGNP